MQFTWLGSNGRSMKRIKRPRLLQSTRQQMIPTSTEEKSEGRLPLRKEYYFLYLRESVIVCQTPYHFLVLLHHRHLILHVAAMKPIRTQYSLEKKLTRVNNHPPESVLPYHAHSLSLLFTMIRRPWFGATWMLLEAQSICHRSSFLPVSEDGKSLSFSPTILGQRRQSRQSCEFRPHGPVEYCQDRRIFVIYLYQFILRIMVERSEMSCPYSRGVSFRYEI